MADGHRYEQHVNKGEIICKVWSFQKTQWLHYNSYLHKTGKDNTKRTFLARITGLYSKQDQLGIQDYFLYEMPLKDWGS
eukprot:9085538-Ditylum_brightwellii.AAC.1